MRSYIQNLLRLYEGIFHQYPKANLDTKTDLYKRIVIFLYSSHGDIALASSLTQYIKKIYPKSKITFVTSKKCKYVASLNPDIDKIHCVDFPKFWNYMNVEKVKKSLDYDMFLNASFYPNLRYLIPFMSLIEAPFFLMRQRPEKLPTPRLKLDFDIKKKNDDSYVVLNLEAGTLGWHKNMLNPKEVEKLKHEIVKQNPHIKFYVNQSMGKPNSINEKNVRIFSGNVKNLCRLMAHSQGIISFRNGFCDVMAASTSISQFVIYPEGRFPDDDGIEARTWGNMNTLGYEARIIETTINRHKPKTVKKNIGQIHTFLNNLQKK